MVVEKNLSEFDKRAEYMKTLPIGSKFKVTNKYSDDAGMVFTVTRNGIEAPDGTLREVFGWEPITFLYNENKIWRIYNMVVCLRSIQIRESSAFLCNRLIHTKFIEQTRDDVRQLINRSIYPHSTLNGWVNQETQNNSYLSDEAMKDLRHRWIDQMCKDITAEIDRACKELDL